MTIKHTDDSLTLTYFAQRNPGSHNHGRNKRTEAAVARALELGAIETRRMPGGHNLQRQYQAARGTE